MTLVIYWYQVVCYAIVGASFLGALWVLWRKEGSSKNQDSTMYESLLVGRPMSEGSMGSKPMAHIGSSQLWTSCWKGVHPCWLLVTRFLSLVVMASFLTWDVLAWDASIFLYYTEWTFSLVMVYFAIGTIISAHGCWVYSKKSSENEARDELLRHDLEENRVVNSITYRAKEIRGTIKLQSQYVEDGIHERAGFWGYLMQTIYQTCGGAVILTDVVFWLVIVPFLSLTHLGLNMLMGCMHTLNAVFLLIDASLNSLPFPWFRLAYFVLWSCIYIFFQWIIHACGFSWWPYPFLELNTPWAPVGYFCLAVVHIPCYGIYALIIKAKNSTLARLFPNAFMRSN